MNPARHPVLLFTMFCLCALLGMMVLRPDQNQRREAELSQMTPAAALADLGGYVPYRPTEQGIAALHARLALAAGDLDLARKLLADLADQHPDNPAVRDFLAETETLAGGTSAAAGHLEIAYRLDPTQERRDRLGLLYRLLGERQKEADLLIGADVQTLTMADLERAVDLLLSEGRSDKAEQLYRGLIAGTTALAGPARTTARTVVAGPPAGRVGQRMIASRTISSTRPRRPMPPGVPRPRRRSVDVRARAGSSSPASCMDGSNSVVCISPCPRSGCAGRAVGWVRGSGAHRVTTVPRAVGAATPGPVARRG